VPLSQPPCRSGRPAPRRSSSRAWSSPVQSAPPTTAPNGASACGEAAAQAGKPLSSWLAEAATSKLRAEALAESLDGWEAEHGVLTAQELARAERELGMAGADTPA
jgi:hypothetical protein